MRKVLSFFSSVAVVVVIYLIVVIGILGSTTIRTKFQGQDIPCRVYIDDEYVGDTPFSKRLGPGTATIRIEPPPGYAKLGTWYSGSLGKGQDIDEELERIEYSAEFTSRYEVITNFKVRDAAGAQVAECASDEDGADFCEVVLPGPGKYSVEIMELCEQEPCPTGTANLVVDDAAPKSKLNWKAAAQP